MAYNIGTSFVQSQLEIIDLMQGESGLSGDIRDKIADLSEILLSSRNFEFVCLNVAPPEEVE